MRPFAFAVTLLAFASSARAAGLEYRVPEGWVDLVKETSADVQPGIISEARSGKYKVYAYDPEGLTEQGAALVSMNIIEQPQPVPISESLMKRLAEETLRALSGMGVEATLEGSEILSIGSAPVGHYWYRATYGPNFTTRQDQYVVSSSSSSGVITFTCPPDWHAEYNGLFTQTVLKTGGAKRAGGFNWSRVLASAVGGALLGGLGGLIAYFARRKKTSAPAAAASSHAVPMWDCPTCKRRVPQRMAECRCGTAKPAAA